MKNPCNNNMVSTRMQTPNNTIKGTELSKLKAFLCVVYHFQVKWGHIVICSMLLTQNRTLTI